MSNYTVRSGDSLSVIATRYRTSVAALQRANGIRNANLIRTGQRLVIPGAPAAQPAPRQTAAYTVRSGDTLGEIASRFRTSVAALQRANGIRNANLIRVGQRIKVPGRAAPGGGAPAPAAPARPAGGGGGVGGAPRLAAIGLSVARSMGGYSSTGYCARGVSRAIQAAYGFKVWGNGNQIDDNLPRNRFRQVNMSLAQALKIPGLVITWEQTASGAGRKYGHTAITAGDGRTSYSDFVDRNTMGRGQIGVKVFMPI